VFPHEHSHGLFRVNRLAGRFSGHVHLLLSQFGKDSIDFERIAFIDTETTGLSGGIGVCAFLVGIGYMSSEGFAVEQFFMHDYPAERKMLAMVIERLAQFDLIASYNGRSFDLPILEGRLVLNGIRNTVIGKAHVDVLHPARRLWRHRLNDRSLKSIERHTLGFQREDDIDGAMVPQAYFSYLRTGERRLLEQILHHNRLDLLSLACVTNLVLKSIDFPQQAPLEHGEDWYGLGTFFDHHRRVQEAVYCFGLAMQAGLPESLGRKCRRMLALAHKKAGNWDDAVRLWTESSRLSMAGSTIFELEELAKYYEHRVCDYNAARDICRRAVTSLEIQQATTDGDVSGDLSRFEQRLSRVERKVQREKVCAKQRFSHSQSS
jgi:hypothetical protein